MFRADQAVMEVFYGRCSCTGTGTQKEGPRAKYERATFVDKSA